MYIRCPFPPAPADPGPRPKIEAVFLRPPPSETHTYISPARRSSPGLHIHKFPNPEPDPALRRVPIPLPPSPVASFSLVCTLYSPPLDLPTLYHVIPTRPWAPSRPPRRHRRPRRPIPRGCRAGRGRRGRPRAAADAFPSCSCSSPALRGRGGGGGGVSWGRVVAAGEDGGAAGGAGGVDAQPLVHALLVCLWCLERESGVLLS